MGWFRREPLHARLAREGGLEPGEPPPHDPGPHWGEVGIHGVARPREWDAVVTADAPRLPVGELEFVVLPDGTLVVDDDLDLEPGSLDPLASAVEAVLKAPYRATAVWNGGSRWGVAARKIDVVRLPPTVVGEELTLSVAEGVRSLVVDGLPSLASIPELDRLGESRGRSYVIRAQRLAETAWEVQVSPL